MRDLATQGVALGCHISALRARRIAALPASGPMTMLKSPKVAQFCSYVCIGVHPRSIPENGGKVNVDSLPERPLDNAKSALIAMG